MRCRYCKKEFTGKHRCFIIIVIILYRQLLWNIDYYIFSIGYALWVLPKKITNKYRKIMMIYWDNQAIKQSFKEDRAYAVGNTKGWERYCYYKYN